ncbi:hypothetical protein FRC15_010715 [Serendipita sp. 397]|nr:hypothetical protein FRC15_010715 [Serendipita sp. 397]
MTARDVYASNLKSKMLAGGAGYYVMPLCGILPLLSPNILVASISAWACWAMPPRRSPKRLDLEESEVLVLDPKLIFELETKCALSNLQQMKRTEARDKCDYTS